MTLPAVGVSAPAIKPTRVVFPAPFGPIMPSTSPWRTEKLMASTAGRPPKRFVTCSSWRSTPVVRARVVDRLDAVGGDEASDTSHSFHKWITASRARCGLMQKFLHQWQEPLWQKDGDD